MSKTTNRDATSGATDTVDTRLARLLDSEVLARVVPHLSAETLHHLIRYKGLDACGELLTTATPAQLTSLLDLDLWRHREPGRDEKFDVDRFGEWLEVLVDAGESVAARTVAALDRSLVIAGLSRYVRVFDSGTFEPTEMSDDESIDRHEKMNSETPTNVAECEVGGYLVRARRNDAWDAVIMLLSALETAHSQCFHAVMQGCRRLSNSTPEADGLDELLVAPEQHLLDVAIEREQRQSRRGYATTGDARAFLTMARRTPRAAGNPIATAYFRAIEEEAGSAPQPDATEALARDEREVSASVNAIMELLAEAGMAADQPRALLAGAGEDPAAARSPLLTRLMAGVQHHDEAACLRRSDELGFLANTLLAGCSVQSRSFTPAEAATAVAAVCNLGLEWSAGTDVLPDTFLVDHELVPAFEVGWSVLYKDVSLFVADQLIAALRDLTCLDADIDGELRGLRRELTAQRKAGTPWLARDAAEVLAMLDPAACIAVLGLLDECPIVPAALGAVLERSRTPVNPSAFDFISTKAQIGDVRVFMRTLPGLLSG